MSHETAERPERARSPLKWLALWLLVSTSLVWLHWVLEEKPGWPRAVLPFLSAPKEPETQPLTRPKDAEPPPPGPDVPPEALVDTAPDNRWEKGLERIWWDRDDFYMVEWACVQAVAILVFVGWSVMRNERRGPLPRD